MSLFDSASLVVTPNGQKAGKLYSIKPSDGSGDLIVTRATSATRVDANGLVEIPRTNLVLRSEEFDNTMIWPGSAGIIRLANQGIAPNGTNTMDLITFPVAGNSLSQSVTVISGATYTFSIWLATQSGTQTVEIGNINSGVYQSVTVTTTAQRFEITQVASSTNRFPAIRATANYSILIWGAQLEQGNVVTEYIPTVASIRTKFAGITQDGSSASNIPRLDYTNGSCPSILVEPQRTNLALYSEQFDNASWLKTNTSVTANSIISPSGTLTADTITASGIIGLRVVQTNAITFTSGTSYSLSVFAKKGTNNFIQLLISGTMGGMFANFDLNNGVVGTLGTVTGSNPTSSITNLGNGWYRCVMNFTANATIVQVASIAIVSSASAVRAEANTLTTSVYLWGGQLETGAYPTSYIPTTSASVTRNADGLSKANVYTNGWVSSTGGTFFVDLKNNVPQIRASAYPVLFLSSNTSGTGTTSIGLGAKTTSSRLFVYYIKNGTFVESVTTTADNAKIAIAWTPTTMKIFQNGVLLTSITGIVWDITTLQNLNEISQVTLNINSMTLFPTPLTDDECINLTTI